ncbi:hypothetical protein AB4097_19355 [Microvirga sp. 2MCAF35]|uniref:hypothetical protein n=1 Tax=Microvirga sp. 2MCAF35 TaxID=3232987 RepID=UPI003F96B359
MELHSPKQSSTLISAALFGLALCLGLPAEAASSNSPPKVGAAEKADGQWPYPEPAQPGATGYVPDYTDYKRPDEQADIEAYLLWRATNPKARKSEAKFWLSEYERFMAESRGEARKDVQAEFISDFIHHVIGPIRSGHRTPPFFDNDYTDCWIFFINRNGQRDLHAGNCKQ